MPPGCEERHVQATVGDLCHLLGSSAAGVPTTPVSHVASQNHHQTNNTVPSSQLGDHVTGIGKIADTVNVEIRSATFDPVGSTLEDTIYASTECIFSAPTNLHTPTASISEVLINHGEISNTDDVGSSGSIAPIGTISSRGESQKAFSSSLRGSSSSMNQLQGFHQPPSSRPKAAPALALPNVSSQGEVTGVSKDQKVSGGFQCDQLGCRSRTIFKRKYELKRHIETVHKRTMKFPCPVTNCYKKGSESLTRPDKFREHLRVSHTYDDVSECPDSSCSVTLPLLLLQLHVKNHSRLEVPRMKAIGGYMEVNDRVRGCPVEGCRKSLPAQDLHDHLAAAHTEEQREMNRVAITTGGFDHVRCTVICPVCKIRSPSFDEAREHVLRFHICIDYDHYKSMRNVVEQVLAGAKKHQNLAGIRVHDALCENDTYYLPRHSAWKVREAQCPQCSAVIFRSDYFWHYHVIHELDLLRPADALFEHRLGLLKLFPAFDKHPVFAPDWPIDNERCKETIEKHFSHQWIKDHRELVYGTAAGIGASPVELYTTNVLA